MNNVTNLRYVFAIGDLGKVQEEYSKQVHVFFQDKAFNILTIHGYFEGKDEHSFLVAGDVNTEKHILQVCRDFKQDSYLRIHNDNHTELVFTANNKAVSLGAWTNVGKNKPTGPFSYILGDYFMVEPNEG